MAAQPYRSRLPAELKVKFVLDPLTRALAPDGRMIAIQSTGKDPGMEIVGKIWPDDDPFPTPRHELLRVLQSAIGDQASGFRFDPLDNNSSLFHFHLHVMSSELGESIGTSTLLAAWNAAIYVAQINDAKLHEVLTDHDYLDITRDVLRRHGGLWFTDESFVVSRRGK